MLTEKLAFAVGALSFAFTGPGLTSDILRKGEQDRSGPKP